MSSSASSVVERRCSARSTAHSLPAPFEHVRARVAQRDDLALLVLEIARDVQRRDVADADDSDANGCHGA